MTTANTIHPTTTISYRGRTFTIAGHHRHDLLFRRWRRSHRFYELDLLEAIARLGRRGVYIDVGAHVGNHSIFFANFCPCAGIIAIEARCETWKLLNENLERNADNVHRLCLRAAVYDKPGFEADLEPLPPGNTGASKVGKIRFRAMSGNNETCLTDTLDRIYESSFDDIPAALIKIDVEGMECSVLDGGMTIIRRDLPALAIESTTDEELAAVRGRLEPLGYKIVFQTKKSPRSYLWVAQ